MISGGKRNRQTPNSIPRGPGQDEIGTCRHTHRPPRLRANATKPRQLGWACPRGSGHPVHVAILAPEFQRRFPIAVAVHSLNIGLRVNEPNLTLRTLLRPGRHARFAGLVERTNTNVFGSVGCYPENIAHRRKPTIADFTCLRARQSGRGRVFAGHRRTTSRRLALIWQNQRVRVSAFRYPSSRRPYRSNAAVVASASRATQALVMVATAFYWVGGNA